ncbi:hypothetical protein DXD95_04145 [Agathobacter rectalis]|uniref:Uncharacterized protein n=1 Tax=Agathobacter rectalis TaxID=39491 RepID=A0A3E4EFA3_9FIRM|nr:hypothetical protein [Agathobacter rectalis]RGI69680.1 hypothetical protein DXD95_04145 [Agathobacter rectalis]
MIASYREQVERLKSRIEEKDTSRLHILDLQKDGTYLDTDTKIVYRNWEEVEKKLSGTVIIDDIPEDEEINEGVQDDCE